MSTQFTPILSITALLLCVVCAKAQTVTQNYVAKRTMLDSGGACIMSVDYYDGLGRCIESAIGGQGNENRFLYSTKAYDANGNITRQTLLVPGGVSPHWMPIGEIEPMLLDYYDGDSAPYAETAYNASGKPEEVWGAGEAWRNDNHSIKYQYATNKDNEVRRYTITAMGQLKLEGYYQGRMLYKETVTDEDNRTTTVYTDFQGRKVLQVQGSDAYTYYIYDDFGRLCFVLPPALHSKLSSVGASWDAASEPLHQYAYCYRYDARGYCSWKQLPGCGPVTMEYDRAGQLLFSSDGNQSQRGRQTFHLYDNLGREVVTGECKKTENTYSQIPITASYTGSGTFDGYDCSELILSDVHLMAVNYYDDYSFLDALTPAQQNNLAYSSYEGFTGYEPTAKGLLTGKRVYHLDDPTRYETTALFYDIKGQLVSSRSTNHIGGTETTYSDYTFTGQPLSSVHIHTAINKTTLTEKTFNHYDVYGRLSSTDYTINGKTVKLQQLGYDALGRLAHCLVGNLEYQNYRYNLRGWQQEIDGQRFSEVMCYNSSIDGLSPLAKQYSGNISAYRWKNYVDKTWRGYQCGYDNNSRLVSATYGEGTNLATNKNKYTEYFAYDLMGNVTGIQRNGRLDNGSYGLMDDLSLYYNGNQLQYVDNAEQGAHYTGVFSYPDHSSREDEYEYDKNGNLTKNLDRKIAKIEYNVLNLPSKITSTGTRPDIVEYSYDAAGRKLKSSYYMKMGGTVTPARPGLKVSGMRPSELSADSLLVPGHTFKDSLVHVPDTLIAPRPFVGYKESAGTTYCDNILYEDNKTIVLNPHGYAEITKNTATGEQTTTFYYYIKDHLGNNRVVLREDGEVMQQNHYYPYGALMAESSESDVQRYKFGGKELDRKMGLDLYDYGARWYDPVGSLGFTTMDPLAEEDYGISPYVYCRDNPVRYIDMDGEKPGDHFKYPTLAAIDFGKIYNEASIHQNREFATFIYKMQTKTGEIYYTYPAPAVGAKTSVSPKQMRNLDRRCIETTEFRAIAANIHTHAAYDERYDNDHFFR